MKYPKLNWVSSFPDGELAQYTPNGQKILLVGMDTEYTRLDKNTNLCLSYQFSALDFATGMHKTSIYYVDHTSKVRLKLKETLLHIFDFMGIEDSNIDGYHIIFICHFCTAEWSMMRDREEIAKHFDFLYKTLITFKLIDIRFTTKSEIECCVTFEMGDTMLLLPPSHRSLAKATSLLDSEYHKKDLSQSEKEDMLTLLQNDRTRFEEYALHDAEITLRLYIKLQHILNQINGSTSTRYTTIGSATVKHFQRSIDKKVFKSQFSKKNEIYQKGLNLASRAYMGGLSSSYYVGEAKGELFLDIDFSSAYPTVMNLLQLGDFGKAIKYNDEHPEDFTLGEVG